MDDVLTGLAIWGRCPDCGDDVLLVPADETGADYCCADCDAAVMVLDLLGAPAH